MKRLNAIHTEKPSVAENGTRMGNFVYRGASSPLPFGDKNSAIEGYDRRPTGG